jgi:hypothetical protein
VFNRAFAKENPWIQRLRETGAYDVIRKALQDAARTYKSKNPVKRKKTLDREITKLNAQLDILEMKQTEDPWHQNLAKNFQDFAMKPC